MLRNEYVIDSTPHLIFQPTSLEHFHKKVYKVNDKSFLMQLMFTREISNYRVRHLTFCSFSKKNDPIMSLGQIPHQTVTRFKCVGFSMYAYGFSVPQNATILLVYMPDKIKMSFIWKDDFFLPKSAYSVSRSQAHLFVRRKDKTNYLSNQTWAKCYHSRNKH